MKRVLLSFVIVISCFNVSGQTSTPNVPCAIVYSGQNGGGNCNPAIADGKNATGQVKLDFNGSVLIEGYETPTIEKIVSQADGKVYTFTFRVQSVSVDGMSVTYCFYGVAKNDNVFNQKGNLLITLKYTPVAGGDAVVINKDCQVVGSPITLPVSFGSFVAARNKQNVSLSWQTATEQNNRGFYVQRNTRGVWENIAWIFSQADGGNSSNLLTYTYKDINNERGVSQYRIQQVDFDGKASYSVIRSVMGEEQRAKTTVYPNPSADGKVNVVFEDQAAKAVTVSDLSGRVVRQYRNVLNNVQIEGLESGMYSIQVTDLSSAVSTTEKVIIKKR